MNIESSKIKKLGLTTTIAFVIANMIGVGVFTSLGFQLTGTHNVVAVLLLWVIGGIMALCGALVYSELGAAMPRSGGEYHYLSKIYHPYAGFLAGWISITVGFAAPIALACMALGQYSSQVIPFLSPVTIAVIILVLITLVHAYDIKFGGNFQNVFTSFKVLLICGFILGGLLLTPHYQHISRAFKTFSFHDLLSSNFAVSLVYVSYAFSGWNASAYIASEIKEPQKIIPKSLFISTLLVTVLYFMLNLTFLLTAPVSELQGQVDVGYISASKIFGATGGTIMAGLISILLVSTISSMIFVGPRVSLTMGEDMPLFRFLAFRGKRNTPLLAILLQSSISLVLLLTASFNSVMMYAGFTLSVSALLTVIGVFVHRARYKDAERPYKTWGYPVVPILYSVGMIWTICFQVYNYPVESLLGMLTLFSGTVFYVLNWYFEKKPRLLKVNQFIKIMKSKVINVIVIIIAVYLMACSNGSKSAASGNDSVSNNSQTAAQTKAINSEEVKKIKHLNDIANFISGIPDSTSEFHSLMLTPEWQSYSAEANASWDKFKKVSDQVIAWRSKEIPKAGESIQTLFYPFGGPDYLFANIFFPNAQNYIMIGLEKPGSAPQFADSSKIDLKNTMTSYRKAIENVIQLSFFRTLSMKEDLTNKAVDGTAPVMMIFLARSGKQIIDVQSQVLDSEGKLVNCGANDKSTAINIKFRNPGDTLVRNIYYLSTNLADPSLKENKPFLKFLNHISDHSVSFVKSATYLMHKSYFSIIRNTVLAKSDMLLQDDSGIAYKFFDKDKMNITLYGTYEKPINLFKDFYEPDLFEAFKKGSKPLNFRIGYNQKSLLLLAQRK